VFAKFSPAIDISVLQFWCFMFIFKIAASEEAVIDNYK
jgi:hypothetical protein